MSKNMQRKRKKKFLYRAQKKFKEERFGHVLDKETYEYFLRIAENLKLDHNNEEKSILAENVLKETEGKENDLTSHPLAARVLEGILPWSKWDDLEQLRSVFTDKRHWGKFGCQGRVQESLIKEAGRRVQEQLEEKDECLEYIKKKSMFFLNNLEEQIEETNLNHMTRTCLEVCAGCVEYGKKDKESSCSPILPEVVKEYTSRISNWPLLSGIYKEEVVSGFLQILLRTSKISCPKTCKKLNQIILESCLIKDFNSENCNGSHEYFDNVSRNRLLEAVVEVSSIEQYEQIYSTFFTNNIKDLAIGEKSHFIVSKLLAACPGKLQFELLFNELEHGFKIIIEKEYFKVLVSLSECCLKFGVKQGEYIKLLKEALNCGANEKGFIHCVLFMKAPKDLSEGKKILSSIHGSFIIQNMLSFKKPIKIVETILGHDADELKSVAEDPKGSRIFDAFMSSQFVGEKSRDRLIAKFQGSYCELAMTKFGSRVFDALWQRSSPKQKEIIMKDLSRRILSNQYGSKIAQTVDLNSFLNDKKNWNPSKKSN